MDLNKEWALWSSELNREMVQFEKTQSIPPLFSDLPSECTQMPN